MVRETYEERELAGTILLNTRIENGMTQKEVADEISSTEGPTCSERHYRRIEKGEMTPSITLGLKVCAVLGISPFDVWGSA